jgi:hypothetical protein
MKSKGKTYKSHYATILAWDRKDKKEKDGKDKRFSGSHHERVPKQYESPEELRAFLDD